MWLELCTTLAIGWLTVLLCTMSITNFIRETLDGFFRRHPLNCTFCTCFWLSVLACCVIDPACDADYIMTPAIWPQIRILAHAAAANVVVLLIHMSIASTVGDENASE